MLHYKTIDSGTLELLKSIQSIPEFENMRLVGGTSLAMQIGHRKSIDIDLFGQIDFGSDEVIDFIRSLGTISTMKNSQNIHIFVINNIKVDIINYSYPWLTPAKTIDSLRLAGLEDICAMKLAAITGRGSRKDFIDIFFLLRYFTMEEMLSFYTNKYADGSPFMVIKSLTYYEDAENEPEPYMFEPADWKMVKAEISKQVIKLT